MRRHLVALVVMLVGSSMVFGLLIAMNEFSSAPEKEEARAPVKFEAPPEQKKKKKKTVKKREQKPQKPRPTSAPPPAPDLASSLSTVSLGLPDVAAQSVGNVSDKLLGDVKTGVMTEDSVDSKPRPMRRTAASYPPRARAEGVTGYVTLNLLIDQTGRVERVKVLEAQPAGVFEQTAQETVRNWHFEPATYEGEAVKVWARQTVRFDLS